MALRQKKPNKLWVWKAYNCETGHLIDWECGGRDRATLQGLMDRLQAWDARLICTDGYQSYTPYTEVIPVGRHYQGKDQTFGVERTIAQQRDFDAAPAS